MKEEQARQLKAATDKMEKVVATMQYHTKLKNAWKGLKKAIDQATRPEGPEQVEIFPQKE